MKTLLTCVFFLFASSLNYQAQAGQETIPATATPTYSAKILWWSQPLIGSTLYATKAAVCTAHAAYQESNANSAWDGTTCTHPDGSDPVAYPRDYKITAPNYFNPGAYVAGYTATQPSACPAGYSNTGQTGANACMKTTYTCPSATPPWTLSGSNCTRFVCAAGEEYSSGYYDYGEKPLTGPPRSICKNGCAYNFEGTIPAARRMVGGVYHYLADGAYVGTVWSCSPDTVSTVNPTSGLPAPTCGAGQGMGTMNGENYCYNLGTNDPVNPNAPRETTTTEGPTVTNPDGSTTKTTTTESDDGPKVTTIETTSPTGEKTTTVSKVPQITGVHGNDLGAPATSGDVEEIGKKIDKTNQGQCGGPDQPKCKFETDPWTANSGDGSFESKSTEIADKKSELSALINQIKGEAESMFSFSGSGSATLGCTSIGVLGTTISTCASKYEQQLQAIPSTLILVAYLLALFIILG